MTANQKMPKALLLARPFGYAIVTVVHVVILTTVVVLGWGGLFIGIERGFGADGPSVIACLGVVLVVSPIFGPALVMVTALSTSLTMLAGLAFVRSLMPGFRDVPLTYTIHSDTAPGPVRLTKGALSLLPTRPGRFAHAALALNLGSLGGTWRRYVASVWLGVADLVTAGWVRWPATGPFVYAWALVSLALLSLGIVGFVRSLRQPPTGRTGRRLP